MDHSNGTQPEQFPLPLVETLRPGLVFLLKRPAVDKRPVYQHIEELDEAIRIRDCGIRRATFKEMELSTGHYAQVRAELKMRRDAAIRDGRVEFILAPLFKPRMTMFQELGEAIYVYLESALYLDVIVQMTYSKKFAREGKAVEDLPFNEVTYLHRLPPAPPTPDTHRSVLNEITITVSGVVHSGRSAISGIIRQALAEKWPDVEIDWQDPDGLQEDVLRRLHEGNYQQINASRIRIVNHSKVADPRKLDSGDSHDRKG